MHVSVGEESLTTWKTEKPENSRKRRRRARKVARRREGGWIRGGRRTDARSMARSALDRSKTTLRARRRRKNAKEGAKMNAKRPENSLNDLKTTRKHPKHCMFSDGPFALDLFEICGLLRILIL